MSSEWETHSLDSLCKKITDGAHQSPKSVDAGKPMASVKDLTPFGVDLTDARQISLDDFNVLVKQGCQPIVGDVLIAKDGNSALDTVCCVDTPLDAVLLSSVAILRPNSELLDSHFLKHYLSSREVIDYLKSNFISGAAIPRVVLRDFKKAEVNLPQLKTQKAIAAYLDMLDDRIKLLYETNATLEAIAQALFKSWFVDFDPVRAKAEGRLPDGIDAVTAELFPEAFEETELGLVPRGWVIGRLIDFAKLKGGKMLGKEHFSVDGEFPVYGGAGEMGRSNMSNAEGFVITVGRVGAYCGQYFWHSGKAWVNNNASHVIPHNVNYSVWLYQWLRSVDMDLIKKGAAQPFVSNGDIENLQIILPDASVIEEFVNVCEPLFERMSSVLVSISTLTSLRDTLLPRLISGQLRIADAEAELEKATA